MHIARRDYTALQFLVLPLAYSFASFEGERKNLPMGCFSTEPFSIQRRNEVTSVRFLKITRPLYGCFQMPSSCLLVEQFKDRVYPKGVLEEPRQPTRLAGWFVEYTSARLRCATARNRRSSLNVLTSVDGIGYPVHLNLARMFPVLRRSGNVS